MRTIKGKIKRFMAMVLLVAMMTSSFGAANVNAATNGIVKGPDTQNVEDSYTTTLSSGEKTVIKIANSVLTIKVGSSEYEFKIGNISKTTDAAVVNEKDALLHILTLGGAYYVFDLYTGVQVAAYRNISNGKYCSAKNSNAYMVYGKSLINNQYFYELLTSNSVTRELLMTREEFDIIVNGGDPSVEPEPTPEPTPDPTPDPKPEPDVTIESETKFNFEFWWKQYTEGVITWEQLTQAMWQYQWTANSESTETSTTYYFYDADGKLIRTETVTKTNSTENGSGTGETKEETSGEANVEIKNEGQGEVQGTASTVTNIYVNQTPTVNTTPVVDNSTLSVSKKVIVIKAGKTKKIKYSAKNSNGGAVKVTVVNPSNVISTKVTSKEIQIKASKKAANCTYSTIKVKNGNKEVEITVIISKTAKAHARVVTSGKRIKLFTKKNQLHGWLEFSSKKGTLNWNGYHMKGVKSCGFIRDSWNVIVLMENGKVYKLPKTVKKGKTVHKKRIKLDKGEKGIALNRDSYGFVKYVKTDCGGLLNVTGK